MTGERPEFPRFWRKKAPAPAPAPAPPAPAAPAPPTALPAPPAAPRPSLAAPRRPSLQVIPVPPIDAARLWALDYGPEGARRPSLSILRPRRPSISSARTSVEARRTPAAPAPSPLPRVSPVPGGPGRFTPLAPAPPPALETVQEGVPVAPRPGRRPSLAGASAAPGGEGPSIRRPSFQAPAPPAGPGAGGRRRSLTKYTQPGYVPGAPVGGTGASGSSAGPSRFGPHGELALEPPPAAATAALHLFRSIPDSGRRSAPDSGPGHGVRPVDPGQGEPGRSSSRRRSGPPPPAATAAGFEPEAGAGEPV
eukprot:tig00000381_g24524.t1